MSPLITIATRRGFESTAVTLLASGAAHEELLYSSLPPSIQRKIGELLLAETDQLQDIARAKLTV